MRKLSLGLLLISSVSIAYAYVPDDLLNNPLLVNAFTTALTDQNLETEPSDIAALHSVIRDSNLYKLLMTMHITVPNMSKTAEYVLMYNELHQVNHNLESILAELKEIEAKLD